MTHSQVMIKTIWYCINKQMVDVTIFIVSCDFFETMDYVPLTFKVVGLSD